MLHIVRLVFLVGAFILALGAVNPLAAQCQLSIRGTVWDTHTHEPLSDASILLDGTNLGANSDLNGLYELDKICAGTYVVHLSHIGCEAHDTIVNITENTSIINFALPHTAHELATVSVTAKAVRAKSLLSETSINGTDLDRKSGESLGDALKSVTGVSVLRTGNSIAKPMIHGLTGNRILILNNGIRQEGQQWGNEHAPEIDAFMAGNLRVIKGAEAVRYGADALAGVVVVEPRALRDSAGIGGAVNLAAFSNNREGAISSWVEQRFKKLPALAWRLQGTFKKAGNARTPNYWLKNTGLEETNFSGTLAYEKERFGVELFYSQFSTKIGIFSGSHIGNLTDLQAAFSREQPLETSGFSYTIDRPMQQVQHQLAKAKLYVLTDNSGKFSLTYAFQHNNRAEYDKHRPLNDSLAALNRPELNLNISTQTLDAVWQHARWHNITGSLGMSAMLQNNTYSGRLFIPFYNTFGTGLFWIERWKHERWQIEGGARFDYRYLRVRTYESNVLVQPKYHYQNVSGSMGVLYQAHAHLSLRANVGTAWRAPSVNELYSNGVHHGAAAVEIGDKNLQPERAINSSLTANFNGSFIRAELNLYHNYIQNFIYLQPTLPAVLTIRGAFPQFRYQQTNARFTGIDANVEFDFLKHFTWAEKASVLWAYNISANDYLVLMPAPNFAHTLRWQNEWHRNNKNNTSLQYFAQVGVQNTLRQTRVPANSDYIAPPAGYTLVNAEAGLTMPFGKKHQTLFCSIAANNLFNTQYRDYLNRFRYFADETGIDIALRLKFSF